MMGHIIGGFVKQRGDSKSWPFQRGMILQPIGFPDAPTLGSKIFAQESETR